MPTYQVVASNGGSFMIIGFLPEKSKAPPDMKPLGTLITSDLQAEKEWLLDELAGHLTLPSPRSLIV